MKITGSIVITLNLLLGISSCVTKKTSERERYFYKVSDNLFTATSRVARIKNAYLFEWPGTGISFKTEARNLTLVLEDIPNSQDDEGNEMHGMYSVKIDGKRFTKFHSQRNIKEYQINNMPEGMKVISLSRLNEPLVSQTQFFGVRSKKPVLPGKDNSRIKIEAIGNSITTGYGNNSSMDKCTFSPETQDFEKSYIYLVAKKVDAELSTVAWSGKGLMVNYNRSTTDLLPDLYPYSLPFEKKYNWNLQLWKPDLVIIHLGTNDFAHIIPEEEKWVDTYSSFLRKLSIKYPQSKFLLLAGPTVKDKENFPALTKLSQYLKRIEEKAAANDLIIKSQVLPLVKGANSGCDAHPDEGAHAAMAGYLHDYLINIWPELVN